MSRASLGPLSPRLRRKSSSPRNKDDYLSPRTSGILSTPENSPRTPRLNSPKNKRGSLREKKAITDSPRLRRKSSSPRKKEEHVSPRSNDDNANSLSSSSSYDSPRYENFERIRILGRGGSGTNVWKVRLNDGSDCCMKEMVNTHTSAVEEFKNEVKALKKISDIYPNLIRFINFTTSLTTLRLFTSLYDGELSGLIDAKKIKDYIFIIDEVIDYMYQLASALAVLHNRRIIHRDIKSSNIFYDRLEGNKIRLVIGDFGEAKIITKKSMASTCRGTPVFSAPEVLSVKETGAYSYAADIWSLGMVMYELMTLNIPYHEIEGFGYIYKIQNGILPTIDMINEEYYMSLIPIWQEMLSLNSIDRPTAGGIMMSLKSIESKN